jgi:uncharacterized delta-60 repeat protein
MEVLADGKVVIAGTTMNTSNSTQDIFLMKIDAHGALDNTFGTAGTTITDDINHGAESAAGLAIQADGKIVVAASFRLTSGLNQDDDFALFRYSAEGTLDATFGGGGVGMVTTDFGIRSDDLAECVQIQQDGKIVVVGWSFGITTRDVSLSRYWP